MLKEESRKPYKTTTFKSKTTNHVLPKFSKVSLRDNSELLTVKMKVLKASKQQISWKR